MNPLEPIQPCPCGSGTIYAHCCGRWHSGEQQLQAPTPQALMRSRYTAFVLGRGDYLQATWHASTRPAEPPEFDPALRWLGLDIKRAAMLSVDEGVVEFVARSKRGGRAFRLHEISRFVREAGQWFYVQGDVR